MKKYIMAACLFLSCLFVPVMPVGASKPIDSSLNSYIQSEFEKTHMKSMSVQIVDKDGVLFSEEYGDCKSTKTCFVLGSISKSFTSAAIMKLSEEGKIDINKPASFYLPSLGKSSKTTVKQLLNQTSGIKTYDTLSHFSIKDREAPWQYANVNYGLLGQIVEKCSGESYSTYINKKILVPLSMDRTFTDIENARNNGLCEGYGNFLGFMVPCKSDYPKSLYSGWMTLPSAYIISDADDMGKYLRCFLNNGKEVLSAESVNTVFNDSVFVRDSYRYGMGWGYDTSKKEPIYFHGGNVENYTTEMILMPKSGLGLIVLTDGCDYFCANNLVVKLADNIAYKLIGEKTDDIDKNEYFRTHFLIDMGLFLILLLSLLPILFFTRWKKKALCRGKVYLFLNIILLHIIAPLFIFCFFMLFGIPLFVEMGFAPDVLTVQCIAAAALMVTGILKAIYLKRFRKCMPKPFV